jgi:hypothetical protein
LQLTYGIRAQTGIGVLESTHFSALGAVMKKHSRSLQRGVLTNLTGLDSRRSSCARYFATELPKNVVLWDGKTVTCDLEAVRPSSEQIHECRRRAAPTPNTLAWACEAQGAAKYPLNDLVALASGAAYQTTVLQNVDQAPPPSGCYLNVHLGSSAEVLQNGRLKLSAPGLFGVLQSIAVGIFRIVSVLPAELRHGSVRYARPER